ncbi:MAG: hypothetical protein JWM20_52 [Patescibacteria group bacterium]|nr:hypothetical protein [Patescibacteria group bacterium]
MISSGWATFKKHWKFIILASIATAIIQIALQVLQRGSERGGSILVLVMAIIVTLIGIVIALGWARVILSLNRHDKADFETFKTSAPTWLRLIKTAIWYVLYFLMYAVICVLPFAIITLIGVLTAVDAVTIVGVILASAAFVLLACYFGLKYQFIYFTVLDYPNLRSKAIFKKAGEITKGSLLNLLGFGVVTGLLNILGLVCLVVGLAVTIPVTKLAQAKVYDFLKEKHEHGTHHAKAE